MVCALTARGFEAQEPQRHLLESLLLRHVIIPQGGRPRISPSLPEEHLVLLGSFFSSLKTGEERCAYEPPASYFGGSPSHTDPGMGNLVLACPHHIASGGERTSIKETNLVIALRHNMALSEESLVHFQDNTNKYGY